MTAELLLALGKLPSELTVPVGIALVLATAYILVTIRSKQGKAGMEQAVGVSDASLRAVQVLQGQIEFMRDELNKAQESLVSLRADLEDLHNKHRAEMEKTSKLEAELLILEAENKVLRRIVADHPELEAEVEKNGN